MPDDVIFLMGKYEAPLPGDRRYARNHMWCRATDGALRFGFTTYAVRLMQDVYFLDWCVDDGSVLALKQQIGNIETSKAVSDLFAPMAGTLARINRDLLKDPSGINVENYGKGWLFDMAGDASELMTASGYRTFLDGEWAKAQRIIKAGGGSSWQDLALYLIARFVGLKEAMEVAKVYMLQWHDMGQQPFAALMGFRQTDDAVINRCQEWAATHYRSHSPVAAMTEWSGLAERSFVRRFTKATGMKPLDYVHALRLEEAKQMLETGDLPVEAIANEVGYEDTSFFGRLFRRKVGLTPAQYRLRFGSLRRVLARI